MLFTDPKLYTAKKLSFLFFFFALKDEITAWRANLQGRICFVDISASLSYHHPTTIPHYPMAHLPTSHQVQPHWRIKTAAKLLVMAPKGLPRDVHYCQDLWSPRTENHTMLHLVSTHNAEKRSTILCFKCAQCLLESQAILQTGIIFFIKSL